ncbi:MAG: glucose-6-phosphate dehydrogenase assembly protein OpcA [Austwickia sp.]|jgi:glucose-6-phosphate dehydrogenase assembly protein OpcA|nr:glucose-6-phosphate dehydrogenase assembly protein OpcA [Austwickia sp.]MBK8435405.1 glucose-6-phosphate dehydrogenase assembly protein OpcA [Austwickia sp.]MBK9101048.1 glucose-6-phosphate dehydrogenase assembly protein OpcA [Austwickia sp.]
MIVDLPDSSVAQIAAALQELRDDIGTMALTRVLTLLVVTDAAHEDEAHEVSRAATHMHPARIVMLVEGSDRGRARLDGQVRVGGDAGASEVVVLRLHGELVHHQASAVLPLLLPDSPIVAWWPTGGPQHPAADPVGALAARRITDAEHSGDPSDTLRRRAKHYTDGDTDLTWTRITRWRGLLAAVLDTPPYAPVDRVTVTGGLDSASADLLAAWLGEYLDCPVVRARTPHNTGLVSARLHRRDGEVDLVRPDGEVATLTMPGQPARSLALPRRRDPECLADELARLDADEVFERVLTRGLRRLRTTLAAGEAVDQGLAPSVPDSRRLARRLKQESAGCAGADDPPKEPM